MRNTYKKIIRAKNKKIFGSDKSGLKLNIACGDLQLGGYINIDSESKYKPDLVVKMQNLRSHFEKNSVAEIVVIHGIGYLNYSESILFFKDSKFLLKPGGMLIIETPDIKKIALNKIINNENISASDIFPIFATSDHGPTHSNIYQFIWTEKLLEKCLFQVGFSKVTFDTPKTHGAQLLRDTRCLAIK